MNCDRLSFARPLLLASLLVCLSLPAAAGSQPATVPAQLAKCVACHGADGIGKAQQYPNLRGQKAAYLEKQLKAFRSGDRKDPSMSAMAKPLTDDDIVSLATYFQHLK